jgi:hypothetical protein
MAAALISTWSQHESKKLVLMSVTEDRPASNKHVHRNTFALLETQPQA